MDAQTTWPGPSPAFGTLSPLRGARGARGECVSRPFAPQSGEKVREARMRGRATCGERTEILGYLTASAFRFESPEQLAERIDHFALLDVRLLEREVQRERERLVFHR